MQNIVRKTDSEARLFWKKVLAEIEIKIQSPTIFRTVFSATEIENLSDNSVDIICKTRILKDTLEKKYFKVLNDAINKINGDELLINFKLKPASEHKQEPPSYREYGPLFEAQRNPEESINDRIKKAGLSPKFVFENYIMGKNNQLAYAIAKAVSEKPGEVYNPVFFYSGVGLGKTHLMQAIGNKIMRTTPSLKIIYTTGESFTNELIESIQGIRGKDKYTPNEFRNKYRKADVLLIDDIQFIAGKEATQEEFFHTFNALYMSQKQIILTSDRPPKDIQNIAERITSRFNSGIIADIQPPDIETRVAILRHKRDMASDPISNEIINIISEKISTNIRELEGAYLRVLTEVTSANKEIEPDRVLQILGQTIRAGSDQKSFLVNNNLILKTVCNYFSIKTADIKGKSRVKELVLPRQVAMYLMKEMTNSPYMAIGDFLGGRDHTTIMHGVTKIDEEIKTMTKTGQEVLNVKKLILSQNEN